MRVSPVHDARDHHLTGIGRWVYLMIRPGKILFFYGYGCEAGGAGSRRDSVYETLDA